MLGKKGLAVKDPTFLPNVLCGQEKAALWSLSQHSKTIPDSSYEQHGSFVLRIHLFFKIQLCEILNLT